MAAKHLRSEQGSFATPGGGNEGTMTTPACVGGWLTRKPSPDPTFALTRGRLITPTSGKFILLHGISGLLPSWPRVPSGIKRGQQGEDAVAPQPRIDRVLSSAAEERRFVHRLCVRANAAQELPPVAGKRWVPIQEFTEN